MNKTNEKNILIVGVGGQGVLLASELLSEAAIASGFDVKKSEVHGMSQRGGVVSSHIRFGEKIYSPLIPYGRVDLLLSFEVAESLRALDWLAEDGRVITSMTKIIPPSAHFSSIGYPEDAVGEIRNKTENIIAVEADEIARELGEPRLVNTILLGVASSFLEIEQSIWQTVIKKLVKPRFVDINLEAFARGCQLVVAES